MVDTTKDQNGGVGGTSVDLYKFTFTVEDMIIFEGLFLGNSMSSMRQKYSILFYEWDVWSIMQTKKIIITTNDCFEIYLSLLVVIE